MQLRRRLRIGYALLYKLRNRYWSFITIVRHNTTVTCTWIVLIRQEQLESDLLRDVASLRHKVDSLQRENIALSELEKEYKLVKEQVGIRETRVYTIVMIVFKR